MEDITIMQQVNDDFGAAKILKPSKTDVNV